VKKIQINLQLNQTIKATPANINSSFIFFFIEFKEKHQELCN